jgi:hypothetical protein
MSSSSSSKKRKRARQKVKPGKERDAMVEEYLNSTPPAKSEVQTIVTRFGTLVTWEAMSVKPKQGKNIPEEDAADEEYRETGWMPFVAVGKKDSIWLPVYSVEKTPEEFRNLPDWQKERCVPSKSGDKYYYCPRNYVDKEVQGEMFLGHYLANAVRFCTEGEQPNCRFMLDWEKKEGEGGDPCILVSILKTQTPSEWKLDREYARRLVGLVESDDDDSDLEVIPTPGATGRVAQPKVTTASRDDAEDEFRNRVVALVEGNSIHMAEIATHMANMEEGVSKDVPACIRNYQADYRRGNNAVAHRLDRLQQLLEALLLRMGAEIPPVLAMSPRFTCHPQGDTSVRQLVFPPVSKPEVTESQGALPTLVEMEPSPEFSPYSPSK